MKKTITTAAFALLLAAGASQAALAQDGRGQRGGGDSARGQQGGGQQGGFQQRGGGDQGRGRDQAQPQTQTQTQTQTQAQAAPRAPQAREAPQAAQAPPQRQGPPSRASIAEDFRRQREQGQGQSQGQGFRNDQPRQEAPRAQPPQADPRRSGAGQAFDRNRTDQNRSWNGGRDNNNAREQWQRGRYPPVYQSQQRFRIDRYRAPSGFYMRQWGFGDVLPRGWYGSQYYLNDFDYYGLPYPPPGMEWVRVGDDALLIDRFTGRVVQVVRYLFW